MSEQFFTVEQTAMRLRLHRKTVLRLIHENRLRGTRIAQSGMEAFAGARKGPQPVASLARVSYAVDLPDVPISLSERLGTILDATMTIQKARPDPLYFSTIYDP